MKIVIAISHSFCANFITGQASFLKANGCEVVIVSAPGPEVQEVALKEGAKLVEIPFSREISIGRDIRSFFDVIKFLKEEKPDIVNAGNPKSGFLFMLASLFFPSIPMIFTLRGLRSDTLTGFKKKIVFMTEWLSCNLARKVIVISPSLKQHAIDIGLFEPSKGIVLGKGSSNGVNLRKFNMNSVTTAKGKEIRRQLDISETDIIIGHVGRITRDKGIEELYAAFKLCQQTANNLKLLLAGPIENDDPVSSIILDEMYLDEDVFFLGKQADVTGIYAAYDLLVLYSHREGFGNVALEASAMGVPTIVSDIPGARDTTEHMKSGLLVDSKNPPKLAEAIRFYIQNANIREQHGTYGKQRTRDFFSSETIWLGQYDLYKTLIK